MSHCTMSSSVQHCIQDNNLLIAIDYTRVILSGVSMLQSMNYAKMTYITTKPVE